MKKATKLLALALAAVFAAAALAGCAQGAGTGTGTTDTGEQGEKMLIYGATGFVGKFNPIMSDNVYDSQVASLIFESLVDITAAAEYVPELATWEMSNNNRTYTFTLLAGVTFSNGEPLTAEDVAFTYKMIAHPDYDGPRMSAVNRLVGYEDYKSGAAADFEGIKVIDAKTISFTYVDGEAGPANISDFAYGIMCKSYYESASYDEFLTKLSTPIGSGPLLLTEYKPKELIRLEKNPTYWNIAQKEIKIDGVLCVECPNDSILGALQTKQIDFGELTASVENVEAMEAIPHVTKYNFLGNGYTFMSFNCVNGIFDDVRVRQAFMYGLDRQAFIDAEYGDLASVGLAPISPLSWAFPDLSELNPYAFDLEKAAAMLEEAGWIMGGDGFRYKDGKKLSVKWLVYTEVSWPGTLSGLAADSWGKLGVELKIDLMDFNTVSAKTMEADIGDKDFDIFTMGFSLSADPDPTGTMFDGDAYIKGGYNATGWYDQHAQDLLKAGRTEFDQDKRAEIYKEWAALMNELVPTTLVAYRNALWGFTDRVSGLKISAYHNWTYSIFDVEINY